MNKIQIYLCILLISVAFTANAKESAVEVGVINSLDSGTVMKQCDPYFKKTGQCPLTVCNLNCLAVKDGASCVDVCTPKPCFEISADFCPDNCQILVGCSGQNVCYHKNMDDLPECGEVSYFGQTIECCEGLSLKCGTEFLDGTCDMQGVNSVYSVPICVPCGNGICNQFENKCNCPEDCSQGSLKIK